MLEVSVPLPAHPEAKARKVEIQEAKAATKSAARCPAAQALLVAPRNTDEQRAGFGIGCLYEVQPKSGCALPEAVSGDEHSTQKQREP